MFRQECLHSIVLIGNFAPSTFHPYWFYKNGLISKSESDSSKVKIIHPEIADFSLSYIDFTCTPERFELKTISEAHFEIVRDLVIGVITLVSNIGIKSMGINYVGRFVHKDTPQEDYFEKFFLREVFKLGEVSSSLQSLTLKFPLSDGAPGSRNIIVGKPMSRKNDITVNINNSYESLNNELSSDVNYFLEVINHRWTELLSESDFIFSDFTKFD